MHLAKRLALLAAVLAVGAGATACKKDDKKKDDPAAESKKDEGTKDEGLVAKEGTGGDPDKKDEAEPPAEAMRAISGFSAAAREASGGGLGGMSGMGGMLGGLFGGGAEAAAGAPGGLADDGKMAKAADSKRDDDGASSGGAFPAGFQLPPAMPAGGDCTAVVGRIEAIVKAMFEAQMKEEMKNASPEERQLAEQMMASMIPELIKEMADSCTKQNWSQQFKDCILTGASVEALEKCDQYAPADLMGGDSGGGYADEVPNAAAEAPPWTGGHSCDDVATRFKQLYSLAMGDTSSWPEAQRKEIEASFDEGMQQFAQTCKEANFSDEIRKCLVGASTLEATERCWAMF
jgi:hypothetical protein